MSKLKSILLTGFIAGTLDILAAIFVYSILLNKVKAVTLLQGIASGVFGKAAFEGGALMAGLGLLFHYFIANLFSAIYFILFPKVGMKNIHPLVMGIFYGIFVWCVMNLIVLPLSNVIPTNLKLFPAIRAALILIFCVGFPISLMANRYYRSIK